MECWQIVDEFTEVESGKNADRPTLEKALAAHVCIGLLWSSLKSIAAIEAMSNGM